MKPYRTSSYFITALLTLLLCAVSPGMAAAQDLTGLWKGSLRSPGSNLQFEVVMSGSNNKFSGYGLTVFVDKNVENIGIKTVELKRKGSRISFEDDKQVYNNYTSPAKRVKVFANLTLREEGKALTLEGTFTTRSLDLRHPGTYEGTVFLQKQSDHTASRLITKLDSLDIAPSLSFVPRKLETSDQVEPGTDGVTAARKKVTPRVERSPQQKDTTKESRVRTATPPGIMSNVPRVAIPELPAAHMALRKTEVVETLVYASDSLFLTVYDNGEVDGDTVTVVCDGVIILPMQGLTSKGVKKAISTAQLKGNTALLVLYAENLGSIPPNTGLLIIQDGSKKHEIRFAGDMQKNAAILLKRAE